MLEIAGYIITIDAMGAQSELAKKIIEKGADYILSKAIAKLRKKISL